MPGFDEYAAVARQLSARRRGGEQAVAAEAERRRALAAAVEQLGQRLAAQGQRLDQLGQAIGVDAADRAATPAVPVGVTPSGGTAGVAPSGGTAGVPGEGQSSAGTGAGGTGGAAAAPGRAGVGAYPDGGVGETAVPAPRPAGDDPAAELDAARQLADSADRHGREAEALAHRPALLPTWSPLARAVAVYAGCALAGGVLLLVAAVSPATQALGLGLVLAAMCTGVPVVAFVAGHLILGRWGSPVIGGDVPTSRYVPLGFVICALLSPTLYCAYILAFRLLR
ncbi:hypothetical protein ACFO0M_28660 [Micromonospora mangrovi]|uniref:Uncharacterized protein n=2 Tax=Micromonospora TaxID=1873 RepID=A0AAU8HEK0_9ACTN